MQLKCTLQPTCAIPTPILSILFGRIPQVSTVVKDISEDPSQESKIADDDDEDEAEQTNKDERDDWDTDWGWEDEMKTSQSKAAYPAQSASPSSAISVATSASTSSVQQSPTIEPYLASTSADGSYIVLAHKKKFVVVKRHLQDDEYFAIGQGSGCEHSSEEITAIFCLPLFVPSIRKSQIFIMVGYNSGWLKVFSESGVLLTAQILEQASIIRIKMRTPPPIVKANFRNLVDEDEEITILYHNGKVVSIDGQSLWMVLRVCDGQRESGIDTSRGQTAFSYKKWDLQYQEGISDIISLGPSTQKERSQQLSLPGAISTDPLDVNMTTRFVAVGSKPMIAYYGTSDSSRPLLSAVSLASYVVSRVATPVFSLAKSWWTSSRSNPSSRSASPSPYVPDMPPPPTQIEPATTLPSILSLDDPTRRVVQIWQSPHTSNPSELSIAAVSDVLGRVMLLDIDSGVIIRIWKGLRDAVCGWVEIPDVNEPSRGNTLLFLVMYSPRRGLLKIFQMRHGKQVGVFHIGVGWRLLSCFGEPLGSSMVGIERRKAALPNDEPNRQGLAGCLLIGPTGEVREIEIKKRS
ncbi:hypothetical protein VKS41_001419 [Umbelopsis sp. WA50703]